MTRTVSETFTLTYAKYLASKVTSDMRRCQQNYGLPCDADINDYGTELALLLRDNYVAEYEFGFHINNERLLSWKYTVRNSDLAGTDDRPGKILSAVDLSGASFFNQLSHSSTWYALSESERSEIETLLPIQRIPKSDLKDGKGYWLPDLSYSAAGRSLGRQTFRPY